MVQSFSRCIEILKIIADFPDGIRLAEIARIAKLNYTTVYNLAGSMMKSGLILRGKDRALFLGPLVTELHLRREHAELIRHARGLMRELIADYPAADLTYSRFTGGEITAFLNRPHGWMGEIREAKSVLPPYQTVAGLVFLAFLPEKDVRTLRGNFPLDSRSLAAWGSEEALDGAVKLCRERFFSRLPFDSPDICRVAVPLFCKGRLSGALTCACPSLTGSGERELIKRLRGVTEVILEEPLINGFFLQA